MKNATYLINSLMKKPQLTFDFKSNPEPGFATVVLKDNQIVWQKCGGLADVDRRIPITPETNFRLASLSKQFTAMAVMILVERKKLNLENKLTDFFPDYPEYGNQVTVRQLLTHTAGIPDHEKPLYQLINQDKNIRGYDRSVKYSEPTIYEALEVLKSQPTPLFSPGSRYQYSDAGYVLLALIIEKVFGASYRKFLKQNIFKPLEMTGSEVLDQTEPKVKNRALGYKIATGRTRRHIPRNDRKRCALQYKFEIFDYDPLNYIIGDEGVYSSIEDMVKWSRAWNEEILVSQKTLGEALKPQLFLNGRPGKAGFGWLFGKYRGLKIIYQDGAWVGFRNIILMLPDKKLTVIILSNHTDLDTERKRISLAYQLAQEFL